MLASLGHLLAAGLVTTVLLQTKNYLLIFMGFSLVIFFHELGHFLAAKWCDVRVDKFAVGFGKELFGFTRGETRYSFNLLPLGGYVKMLGQEDFAIDKSGELTVKEDPRAFTHKSVGQRMFIVSAGVIMNLIFASFVFMIAFLIGLEFPSSEIGLVLPASPAAKVGLRPGDKIVQINGQSVADFNDIKTAVALSDPAEPVRISVLRPRSEGAAEKLDFRVETERSQDDSFLQVGIAPAYSTKVNMVFTDPLLKPDEQVEPGDVVQKINDKPVRSLWEINSALVALKGQSGDLEVLRPQADGTSRVAHAKRRARLVFGQTGRSLQDCGHLLGFVPRREIAAVIPGERAEQAGVKPGDVVVRWGQQVAPTVAEILDSTASSPEQDIPVTVRRRASDGSAAELKINVRPHASGFLFKGKPRVGVTVSSQEDDQLVVSTIMTNVLPDLPTPAAKLKDIMPRGAVIAKLDDAPVKTWSELADRFVERGGKDVKITWSFEGQPEQSASIHVPATLGTIFNLPPDERITSIAGERAIEDIEGEQKVTRSVENWSGASKVLRKYIGQTIQVEHSGWTGGTPVTQTVTVTPEMVDTWVQRMQFQVIDSLQTEEVMALTRVSNPMVAMKIGLMKTYYFIVQVYKTMKSMVFTRSLGMEQVAGPVGIVKMGSDIAGQDPVKLLYFLALISANLAVINFLPLPIVDGGLFLFLIIEKIKGSPISIRVMVATQVIGLVLIVGTFLIVTFNDLQKLFS